VQDASKFDDVAFKAEMAEATGLQATAIQIEKKEFIVSAGFKFTATEAVTPINARRAFAKAWDVEDKLLEVTTKDGDADSSAGRRLDTYATDVSVNLKTTDAAIAQKVGNSVKAKESNLKSIQENMREVTAVDYTVAETAPPTTTIKLTTRVVSSDGTAIAKPDAARLGAIAAAAGGAGATATIDDTTWKEDNPTDPMPGTAGSPSLFCAMQASLLVFICAGIHLA